MSTGGGTVVATVRGLAPVCMLVAVLTLHAGLASAARTAPQATAACPADLVDGGYCGDGGPVSSAKLAGPRDVAADRGGYLIADSQNSAIRRVDAQGVITTVAGDGIPGDAPPRGPASVATFELSDPRGVAALPGGAFAVADAGLRAVLLVRANGLVRTLRDGRTLIRPVDVVARDADTLVVADAGAGRVFELGLDGKARTLATGLTHPTQIAIDPASDGVYVSEQRDDAPDDVVLVKPDGSRSVVAGPGAAGVAGDAMFENVAGVAAQGSALIVADGSIVRAFFADGTGRVLAGVRPGESGPVNGIAPAQAQGIALTQAGKLLIADSARGVVFAVPDVPSSSDVPRAQTMDEPAIRPAGRSAAAPVVAAAPAASTVGGDRVCNAGTISAGIGPQGVRRGVLTVGAGNQRVKVVLARKPVGPPAARFRRRGNIVKIKVKRFRALYYVRVYARGGCVQDPFRFPG